MPLPHGRTGNMGSVMSKQLVAQQPKLRELIRFVWTPICTIFTSLESHTTKSLISSLIGTKSINPRRVVQLSYNIHISFVLN